jgi:hypothetical protein
MGMDFYDIIMERNALHCYAINAKYKNWNKFKHIVAGIQYHMRFLRSCRIEHVKSDANLAAHGLTREAIKYIIDR